MTGFPRGNLSAAEIGARLSDRIESLAPDLLPAGHRQIVNAGEKVHGRAGVEMHHGRGQAAPRRTGLCSSID